MKKMMMLLFIGVIALSGFCSTVANRSSTTEVYDLIIITSESFSTELQPLAEHKEQHGIVTKIVTLDEIYDNTYFEVKGRDNQEIIKHFIRNAKESWDIMYVILVGNPSHIPVRYSHTYDGWYDWEKKFISELYYADIYDENGRFSSWDANDDGVYGEWDGEEAQDKNIDLYPDICLGRLACGNKLEVKKIVKKIIDYEKNPASSSWFKNMVVVAGDTYAEEYYDYNGSDIGYEGEINTQKALDIMNDFHPIKLWASTGNLDSYGLRIIMAINRGCGFIYFSGHGSASTWFTYTPNWSDATGRFSLRHMLFLVNRNKLPVCIVGGCHNSQFDVNPNPCWSYRMMSKPCGGSIATIGSTGLAWIGVEYGGGGADWLEIEFFKEYKNGTETIGQLWKNELTHFLNTFSIDWGTPSGGISSIDAKVVQQWTLLGDPTLKIGGYP